MIPCLIFEDEHLLVINKPAGLNTHAPGPYAGEGLYDWLRHREPHWAGLAIVHRLDKETSGVLAFGKTALANRSLTEQFARRTVRKKYLLLTDRPVPQLEWVAKSNIVRAGERYRSGARGEPAETRFRRSQAKSGMPNFNLLEAEPLTGRTHQIRVHAAESGLPILGDTLYGGSGFGRVCLHTAELAMRHPAGGAEITFQASVDFRASARLDLRAALMDPDETDAFRLIHGASDGWPGWWVDRAGGFLLSQGEADLAVAQRAELAALMNRFGCRGAYHKLLRRQVGRAAPADASPRPALGEAAPKRFSVRENGVRFELSFDEGYSTGLFLDQRDNRRRLLTGHIAAGSSLFEPQPASLSKSAVLNTFAYTCGFSVGAARAGARTTSLDLSKKYLEWGRRNFALNHLDPAGHDFICGDVLEWLRRLAKQGRRFDVVLLDPPTFSRSKTRGVFRVEQDYPALLRAALPLVRPAGILFASANATDWPAEKFLAVIDEAICAAKRKVVQRHYAPQPPDFPVSRTEPAYLKTVWLRIE